MKYSMTNEDQPKEAENFSRSHCQLNGRVKAGSQTAKTILSTYKPYISKKADTIHQGYILNGKK